MAEQARTGLGRDWTDPEFGAIATALRDTAGLVFPPNRRESAESGMRRVMLAASISDPADLRRAVLAEGEIRDALLTELTVGETFFLREAGQFDFLRASVLPERQNMIGPRRLRLWSAGCATGEEPYSIAMALREAGWSQPASILGTDLATARLAAARRGRYTAWSMRGVHEAIIARYFERRGKQFILQPEIRRAVDFRVLNLASSDYPAAASGIERMDVIFCRNVLIYFDHSTIAAIAARLMASLAPGGWLFLGASDPSIAEMVPCEVVLTGAGLAYRPAGTSAETGQDTIADQAGSWAAMTDDPPLMDRTSVLAWSIPAEVPETVGIHPVIQPTIEPAAADVILWSDEALVADTHESAYERGDYDAAARLARAAIDGGDDAERTWITLVRSVANRGRLDEAGIACASALERHQMSSELTHLHAVLLAEGGHHAEAAVAARRSLYLDPQYAVAHLALGEALSRTGDSAGALRAFANADALLKAFAPDAAVPGADGALASQLRGVARFRLGTLRRASEVTRR